MSITIEQVRHKRNNGVLYSYDEAHEHIDFLLDEIDRVKEIASKQAHIDAGRITILEQQLELSEAELLRQRNLNDDLQGDNTRLKEDVKTAQRNLAIALER